MTDRISTDELRKLLAKGEAGYSSAFDDLERRATDLAAEVIELRQSIDAVMKHIPMDYLQRHDVPGATGPTSSLVIDAAMRDYAEDRWNLIDRFRQEKADNERLREALQPFAEAADGRKSKNISGSHCFGQAHLLKARAAHNHKETGNGTS